MKTIINFIKHFRIAYSRNKNVKEAWGDALFIIQLLQTYDHAKELKKSEVRKNENPYTKWKF